MSLDAGRFDDCHGDEWEQESDRIEAINGDKGMLVLKRNVGQKIRINDDIEIMITGVDMFANTPQVKLGFIAPMCHRIDREEIYWKRKLEKVVK